METRAGLRVEFNCFNLIGPGHPKMFKVRSRRGLQPAQPFFRSKIKVRRSNQVPYPATFMGLLDFRPHGFEFTLQQVRLIANHRCIGYQIKNGPGRSRHRCIEFPAGKNRHAALSHGLLDNLFRAADSPS